MNKRPPAQRKSTTYKYHGKSDISPKLSETASDMTKKTICNTILLRELVEGTKGVGEGRMTYPSIVHANHVTFRKGLKFIILVV